MSNLTNYKDEYQAIIDFAERWTEDEINEQMWNMFIETLHSNSAMSYDLAKMALLVKDLQQLSKTLHVINKKHNKDIGQSPSLN